jgi:preprotein translocase subunit YajC
MLISPAYAQAAPGGGGDIFVSILPLLLIFVVFYFLLIRPQQQKLKQHREMIEALKKGDEILTAGGILGKIARVEPDGRLAVEIAQGVQVKVERSTVSGLATRPTATAAAAKSAADKPAADKPAAGGGLFERLFKKK